MRGGRILPVESPIAINKSNQSPALRILPRDVRNDRLISEENRIGLK